MKSPMPSSTARNLKRMREHPAAYASSRILTQLTSLPDAVDHARVVPATGTTPCHGVLSTTVVRPYSYVSALQMLLESGNTCAIQLSRKCRQAWGTQHTPKATLRISKDMIWPSLRLWKQLITSGSGCQSLYKILLSIHSTAATLGGTLRASQNKCPHGSLLRSHARFSQSLMLKTCSHHRKAKASALSILLVRDLCCLMKKSNARTVTISRTRNGQS